MFVGRVGQGIRLSPNPSLCKVRVRQGLETIPVPRRLQIHGFLPLPKLPFLPIIARFVISACGVDEKTSSPSSSTTSSNTSATTSTYISTSSSVVSPSLFPDLLEEGFLASLAEILADSTCALLNFSTHRPDQKSWFGFITAQSTTDGSALLLSILQPNEADPWLEQTFGASYLGVSHKRKVPPSFQVPISEVNPHPDQLDKLEEKFLKYVNVPKKFKHLEEACERMFEIAETFGLKSVALRLHSLLKAEIDRTGSVGLSALAARLFPQTQNT